MCLVVLWHDCLKYAKELIHRFSHVDCLAQAENNEGHKKKKEHELLFWPSTVALHQGQDESVPALLGPWAIGLVGPHYFDEPTLWCSLLMWLHPGLLSSMRQMSDADWARGDETWLSIGCLLVVSLTDIDIIECCQIWHLRLNQCCQWNSGLCCFGSTDYTKWLVFGHVCFWMEEFIYFSKKKKNLSSIVRPAT